jgi:chitin synthase
VSVPLRRWEDWERSRLRKIRREEKRRREFARAHPQGFVAGDEFLSVPHSDAHSQYDGSDATSIASSDDQWGSNIGEYNENHAQYPPPPVGLHQLPQHAVASGKIIGEGALEAMLESGWDEGPSPNASTDALHSAPSHSVPQTPGYYLPPGISKAPRYNLSDGPQPQFGGGYAPVSRSGMNSPVTPGTPVSAVAKSSALEDGWKTHVKKRSGGGSERNNHYGPLGPLDPSAKF